MLGESTRCTFSSYVSPHHSCSGLSRCLIRTLRSSEQPPGAKWKQKRQPVLPSSTWTHRQNTPGHFINEMNTCTHVLLSKGVAKVANLSPWSLPVQASYPSLCPAQGKMLHSPSCTLPPTAPTPTLPTQERTANKVGASTPYPPFPLDPGQKTPLPGFPATLSRPLPGQSS